MESARITFIVGVFTFLLGPSAGYPDGKVEESCNSMFPLHGHFLPQLKPKHTIAVNVTEFGPDDHVKVTLYGPEFEGFFLQARNADNVGSNAIGSFVLADKVRSQLLTCGSTKNSAVSSTTKSKKTQIAAYWIAPKNPPKRIQFFVTVVNQYTIFWVKIPGPIISQPNTPTWTTLSTAIPTSPPESPVTQPFNTSDCGKNKFCVRNPSNCNPKSNDCFFLAFKRERDMMLVEMSGSSEGYISFALSQDQWMGGGDDAYFCINKGHRVDINTASLTGRDYPDFDSEGALEQISWRLADGLIQCSFRRKIMLPASKERCNLDASYYIFLADGEVSEHYIHKHYRQPLITSGKYNVAGPPRDVGGSRSPFLIKIHGALMFVAWMTTVSIGVIVARFFKPVWPHLLLFGQTIWFQVHRALMLATVLLTSAAFVTPFVYRGGWSDQAGFHPYLGCTVMALAIFQSLMAGVRPPPQAPRRQIFNGLHWSTGTTARILAVVTMFLGMDLPSLNLPDPWDTYTMTGFVAWHVGIDIILEMHNYCLMRKVEVLEDDRIQILQSITTAEMQGHTFKQAVLLIYICGNIAFLIAFLVAIGKV